MADQVAFSVDNASCTAVSCAAKAIGQCNHESTQNSKGLRHQEEQRGYILYRLLYSLSSLEIQ
jgi:hypothetical protein